MRLSQEESLDFEENFLVLFATILWKFIELNSKSNEYVNTYCNSLKYSYLQSFLPVNLLFLILNKFTLFVPNKIMTICLPIHFI